MDSTFWPEVLEYIVMLLLFIVTVLVVMALVLIGLKIAKDVKKEDGLDDSSKSIDT